MTAAQKPLPEKALLDGKRVVKVLTYDGNGYFTVLASNDARVFTHRNRLVFLPRKH